MPERTIRQLRQPLPVNKVMNVGEEKEKAISSLPKKYIFPLMGEADFWYLPEYTHYHIINGKLKRAVISEEQYNSLLNELEDDHKKHRDWFVFNTYDYYPELLEKISKGTWIKPSRAEVEKNAIISVESPEKVGTFAEGGKLINKYQIGGWFPIGYDNNIYRPTYGTMLPEVKVIAKGDPRKVNNDYYKAHASERSALQDRVARRADQGWVPKTMLGLTSVPLDVEGVVGLRLLYEQLPKWVMNVPKNSNRYYRIVDKRAIDDYISSKKIRSAQVAKESGVDTEGPKQAGRFLLKKNHGYNMFSKGEPWQGSLATRDKTKPYILVSKENTGKTIWEQSNIDFRHKGHSGIYRPVYEGDLNATPSMYFNYYKPRLIGYTKHSL